MGVRPKRFRKTRHSSPPCACAATCVSAQRPLHSRVPMPSTSPAATSISTSSSRVPVATSARANDSSDGGCALPSRSAAEQRASAMTSSMLSEPIHVAAVQPCAPRSLVATNGRTDGTGSWPSLAVSHSCDRRACTRIAKHTMSKYAESSGCNTSHHAMLSWSSVPCLPPLKMHRSLQTGDETARESLRSGREHVVRAHAVEVAVVGVKLVLIGDVPPRVAARQHVPQQPELPILVQRRARILAVSLVNAVRDRAACASDDVRGRVRGVGRILVRRRAVSARVA
eukprot:3495696-Pleurochrysis_carterae.AAC.1